MNNITKTQHNPQISQLFDDFAANLPSKQHLAAKVEATLGADATKPQPRRSRAALWVSLAACCLVALLVVAVAVPAFFNNNSSTEVTPSSPQNITVYSDESLKILTQTESGEFSEEVSKIAVFEKSLSESNTFASVTRKSFASFGFKTDNVIVCSSGSWLLNVSEGDLNLVIVAQNSPYVSEHNVEEYAKYLQNSNGKTTFVQTEQNGTHTTKIYFSANSINFYVTLQSDFANGAYAQTLAQLIAQNW